MTPSPRRRPGLARRALPALALTGASGFLLSTLDHPSAIVDAGASTAGVTVVSDAASTTALSTPVTTPPTDPAPQSSATRATIPVTTAATTVVTTVPAAPTCTAYTGPSVSTKWGPVQVQAAVAADGTICSADAIVTPDSKSRSVAINDRAVPVLNDRAMASQGTDFDGISGATITTNAYRGSLQAILDAVASGSVG